MRNLHVSSLMGVLFALAVSCGVSHAASCEFRGGAYSSWEYTDNYLGTPHDKKSETIYEIGPSAELICRAHPFEWSLLGHVARSYHSRFDQDDDTEVDLISELTASGRRDTLELEYAYVQTTREDFFRDIAGETQIHRGTVSYSRTLSPLSTIGLGYTYRLEDNTFPEQDIDSQGFSGAYSQGITPRNTVRATAGYDTYDYEISEDAQVLRSTLGFEHAWSPRTDVGLSLEFQQQRRDGDLPDSDIKSAFLFWGHSLTRQVRVLLSGGYSLLSVESIDDERAFVARGEITYSRQDDVFRLAVAREYTAEFTTDEYGTYDVRRASASWERELLRTLSFLTTITYVERKPLMDIDLISGIERQEEEDLAGRISLTWSPLQYVTVTPSYERIREDDEISDTVVENRYRIIVEVLF